MWIIDKPTEVPDDFILVERPVLDAAMIGDAFTDEAGRRWVLMQRGWCPRCDDADVFSSEEPGQRGRDYLNVRFSERERVKLVPDTDRRQETGRWRIEPAPPMQSAEAPPRAAPDRRRFSFWPFGVSRGNRRPRY